MDGLIHGGTARDTMTDPTTPQPPRAPAMGPVPGGPADNLLRHYVTVLRRRWRWVALGLVVGVVAGIAAAVLIKPAPVTAHYYKATNTLVQENRSSAAGNTADYTLEQAALQIQSQELLDQVAVQLGLGVDDVANRLAAVVRPNVNAIDVTAIAREPEAAVELADAGADALRLRAQAQAGNSVEGQRAQLETELDGLRSDRAALQAQVDAAEDPAAVLIATQRLQELDSNIDNIAQQLAQLPEQGGGFTLAVLQPASDIEINSRGYAYRYDQNVNARNKLTQNTTSNSGPDFDELDLSVEAVVSPRTRVLLGGAAGLVLGLITAFVIEAWDDRVRRRDRVEELTGLGVLTEIPGLSREQTRDHHIATADESTGVTAERYRAARTAIDFALATGDDGPSGTRVLMVTSPGPAEGKTTTVVNMAATFAGDGRRVLVVDGDFRRPTVRRYLAPVPNLVDPDAPCETRIDGVEFLPGPTDAPSPEAAIDRLTGIIAQWRDRYDLVVLDTPPILTTNDAVELLASADAVLLVLRAGRTRASAAERVAELLRQFRADTLGVMLNDCDRAEMDQYYGYAYGYLGAGRKRSKRRDDNRGDTTGPAPAADDAEVRPTAPANPPVPAVDGAGPAGSDHG